MHAHSPFKDRTLLETARDRLVERVAAHDRTERVPLTAAAGRVLAEPVTADRPVPHYARAAMDGYAVRAADTFDAGDRSPAVLRAGSGEVGPGESVQVHTGSELPQGADAVVMIEAVEEIDDEIEVFDAVAGGENVAPVGEDVEAGERLYETGHRLRPSDLGLLKSVGLREVSVAERPTVSVIPTGEELVESDPAPGEVIETNALTVSRYVEAWGGAATYRDVVTDDAAALRAAVERDTDHDVVVTTGGSSVGERDLIPNVVSDIGEVVVHGVSIKPGHPVGAGVVHETPLLMLPGYPVSCIVTAVQLLRPVVKRAGRVPATSFPSIEAQLDEKIHSEPGLRSFVRVSVDERDGDVMATSVRASGAGVLSSVGMADGWVVVPEEREGVDAGETVAVENWEWSA
jgi:molybdopterin molybdotransferase